MKWGYLSAWDNFHTGEREDFLEGFPEEVAALKDRKRNFNK